MTVSQPHVSTRQAAFIGVGAMVGAGIFSLLGAAGEVAGAAVWLSFLLAGVIAALQGYSFAKLGAKYPVGRRPPRVRQSGLRRRPHRDRDCVADVRREQHRDGHGRGVVREVRERQLRGRDPAWEKPFAVAIVVAMTALNVAGSTFVARIQSVIVFVVVGILAVFAAVTIANTWTQRCSHRRSTRRHGTSSRALRSRSSRSSASAS